MPSRRQYRLHFQQALIFGLIWAFFGFVYVIIEKGILGASDYYPATANKYDFLTSLIVAPVGSFFMGVFQGWVEITWLKKKLSSWPFWTKILFKGILYLIMIVLFMVLLTLVINAIRYNAAPWSDQVMVSLEQFFLNFAFWSLVLYIFVILDIALFFSEIRDFVGNNVYYNYTFGKYSRPKKENRIFMFLDMKSSTTIAEKMGHARYFELIKKYFADMTDPILNTLGEVYQYVGDEIVVSWTEKDGLLRNNCIECFHAIDSAIESARESYLSAFGFLPEFKAGLHVGEVTTGEIGTIKKEIIYSGDVLNTAARIQSLCNTYDCRMLISEDLRNKLKEKSPWQFIEMGSIPLRGKSSPIPLYMCELEK